MDAARFDRLAAAFLAVHQHQGKRDFAAFALNGIDRFEGGSAGSDHVIDDDDGVAGVEVAVDLFAGAVGFRFFTDGENLERFVRVLGRGGHTDRQGNRVCAERHAADRGYFQVFRVDFRPHCVPAEVADEESAERIERGHSAVDVEVALFAGGERERAGADGFLEQDFFQGG